MLCIPNTIIYLNKQHLHNLITINICAQFIFLQCRLTKFIHTFSFDNLAAERQSLKVLLATSKNLFT